MPATLSNNARKLLDSLIHIDSDNWWSVVKNTKARNLALTELIDNQLVELDSDRVNCRATDHGKESNRLWYNWKRKRRPHK